MSRSRRRKAQPDARQLSLGLVKPVSTLVATRPGRRASEAARLYAEIGYEVAVLGAARCRLTIEAALRDWSVEIEERGRALYARAYVLRAPEGDDARSRLLEALLAANSRTPNARFALDAGAVVVEATIAPPGAPLESDHARESLRELVGTCNRLYTDLLALAAETPPGVDDVLVLRVA